MNHERVQHLLRIGVVLVVAVALVYVVKPFSFTPSPQYRLSPSQISRPPTSGSLGVEAFTVNAQSTHCGPALLDAWHAKSPPSGWFGYAPLTETSIQVQGSCRLESRHRVRVAALGLLIGIGVLFMMWFLDRRRGPEPGPTAAVAT